MQNEWIKMGTCKETDIMGIISSMSDCFFIAYQVDCFIAGINEPENVSSIECNKLLEIRVFNSNEELLARRTMIGSDHIFQWRIADEKNLNKDHYLEKYQTLDIDFSYSRPGNNGNMKLLSTGGGSFELPISKDCNSIRIISYIGYDEDGMAYIYDNRLAGFGKKGVE